ncbi:MAG: hypothetical protein M3Q75_05615 [Gemmatimonadota bacterium]|nr:hypothetical protein [Gemmatimonadota bacterium]
MTTHSAEYSPNVPGKPASVDQLFRDVPVQSAKDLACEGIFDTDEELDEFLEHLYAARRADSV